MLNNPIIGAYARADSARLDEFRLLAALLPRENGVLIDVGANVGSNLGGVLKRNYTVYAFEPDDANRKVLGESYAGNPQLHISDLAVSDKSGEILDFYTSPESHGISSLLPFNQYHSKAKQVKTITLSDFVAEHHITHIDFLKIDTEGYDFFVLKGFDFEEIQPAYILCEYEDKKTVQLGYTMPDMAEFLLTKGYTVFVSEWHPIIRYGIAHDFRAFYEYGKTVYSTEGWGNLLAFKERPDDIVLFALVQKTLTTKPLLENTPGKSVLKQDVSKAVNAAPSKGKAPNAGTAKQKLPGVAKPAFLEKKPSNVNIFDSIKTFLFTKKKNFYALILSLILALLLFTLMLANVHYMVNFLAFSLILFLAIFWVIYTTVALLLKEIRKLKKRIEAVESKR